MPSSSILQTTTIPVTANFSHSSARLSDRVDLSTVGQQIVRTSNYVGVNCQMYNASVFSQNAIFADQNVIRNKFQQALMNLLTKIQKIGVAEIRESISQFSTHDSVGCDSYRKEKRYQKYILYIIWSFVHSLITLFD